MNQQYCLFNTDYSIEKEKNQTTFRTWLSLIYLNKMPDLYILFCLLVKIVKKSLLKWLWHVFLFKKCKKHELLLIKKNIYIIDGLSLILDEIICFSNYFD